MIRKELSSDRQVSEEVPQISRRDTLRKFGIAGTTSLAGMATSAGTVTASGCGPDNEDETNLDAEGGLDTETKTNCLGESIKLSSSSEVFHADTIDEGDRYRHVFLQVTTAACEDGGGGKAEKIHRHKFRVNGSNLDGTTSEGGLSWCEDETGVKPAGGLLEVDEVYEEVADNALDRLATEASYSVEFMESEAGYRDSVEINGGGNGDFYGTVSYDRSEDSLALSNSYWGKLQSRFELTVKPDVSGKVYLTSQTRADVDCVDEFVTYWWGTIAVDGNAIDLY